MPSRCDPQARAWRRAAFSRSCAARSLGYGSTRIDLQRAWEEKQQEEHSIAEVLDRQLVYQRAVVLVKRYLMGEP